MKNVNYMKIIEKIGKVYKLCLPETASSADTAWFY